MEGYLKKLFRHLTHVIILLLLQCSSGSYEDETPDKAPSNSQKFDAEIKPVLKDFCRRCHERSAFVTNEKEFKKNSVLIMLDSYKMPKSGSPEAKDMSQETREKLIAYILE